MKADSAARRNGVLIQISSCPSLPCCKKSCASFFTDVDDLAVIAKRRGLLAQLPSGEKVLSAVPYLLLDEKTYSTSPWASDEEIKLTGRTLPSNPQDPTNIHHYRAPNTNAILPPIQDKN